MTNTPDDPKPRRWYQFSLRSLGLFIFVLCIALSWLAHELNEVQKRRETMAAIDELGGGVTIDLDQSYRPRWMRPLLGDNTKGEVIRVDLTAERVADTDLVHLACLPKLEMLWLGQTGVTDAGLAHVARLTKMELLTLSDTQVSDAGMMHLSGLKNLWALDLDHTQVTDAGLAHLTGLSNLGSLSLNRTNISDAGLIHLVVMKGLIFLALAETQVTDHGILSLQSALPGLKIRR